MSSNNFSNRRRPARSTASTGKSRSRIQNNGIVEGMFVPFKVINAEDGGKSKYSDYSTHFELEHLATKAKIKTVVFGDVLPNSVDSKILDCILPPEVQDYDPEDLIGGSFEALLTFNTQGVKTYINIQDVRPLQPQHQKLLQQQPATEISEIEDELDDSDLFSEEVPASVVTKQKSTSQENENVYEEPLDDDETLDLDLDLDITEDDECDMCDGSGCEYCSDDEDDEPESECCFYDDEGCDMCQESNY